jgi:hypothetical protein
VQNFADKDVQLLLLGNKADEEKQVEAEVAKKLALEH